MPGWSFLYQYAVGGIFFLLTTMLLVRAGAIDVRLPTGRRALVLMVGGFLFYAGLHAASVFFLVDG